MIRKNSARSPHIHVVESSAAELRLADARAFVERHSRKSDDLHIVGATRGAVDDLVRSIAVAVGATVGLHRFSLTHLAVRLAAPVLAAAGDAPSTFLGSEAVAARAAFDAQQEGDLSYFAPVARMPGFARALSRTLQELRLAGITREQLAALPLGGRDLGALLDRFDAQFKSASARDRATLFRTATHVVRAWREGAGSGIDLTALLLLLDVPLDSPVEFDFVSALMETSRDVLVTVPFGDLAALDRLELSGGKPDVRRPDGPSDLDALRLRMFAASKLEARTPLGDVQFFSAPGEGRECVEVARRILAEARAGVRFDEIAVFVRAPQRYVGLLEHAFRRAGIEAYFERGTERPHPAGRAFLAILACKCEKLSARRFAEYLSLAQVPQLDGKRREFDFIVPEDEVLDHLRAITGEVSDGEEEGFRLQAEEDTDATAVVEGVLRAPWKWETLIVESAVIGGDPQRWHRRLDGLDHEYRIKMAAEAKEDPGSPRVERLKRDRQNLLHLRRFALPIIDELASWPAHATWGEWLDRFSRLAPRILRYPDRVLRALSELRPMSGIGPVSLDEARDVIADRLLRLEKEPPKSRYGRVFVGSPHQARGRTFIVAQTALAPHSLVRVALDPRSCRGTIELLHAS